MGKILLFYKYIRIDEPHDVKQWQKSLCIRLHLKGRILVSKEGINATVGGTEKSIAQYVTQLKQHELFGDIDFKYSNGSADEFPRLRVAVRSEIVTLGIDPEKITSATTGIHLSPAQTHALLSDKPKDLVVFDARNNYESSIGTFQDAITPDIKNFRELPAYLDYNAQIFKNKQVLMFCTGGVRCERATALLKEKNIAKEVYQIEGGIHNYTQEYPNGYFRGKNYVFDGRIAVRITDDILGFCYLCHTPSDEYTNCLNVLCNRQYLGCATCLEHLQNTCSRQCQNLVATKTVSVRSKPAQTTHIS